MLAGFFIFQGWWSEEAEKETEKKEISVEVIENSQNTLQVQTESEPNLGSNGVQETDASENTFVESGPEPEIETLDDLLKSPEDREVWRECLNGEPPENTNLLEWADNVAEGGRRVHWARTRFRDTAGQEFELAFSEGDEGEASRLQLFKSSSSGTRGELVREEILSYEESVSVASEWIEAGQKLDEEVSVSYLSSEFGEIYLQLKNMAPSSLVVKRDQTALTCSLRGTRPGRRCSCGEFGP